MRVIIAGSKGFSAYHILEEYCDFILQDQDNVAIIIGTAIGAAQLGEKYAKSRGYKLERLPVDEDADGLIAFWDGESRGTSQMIASAKRRGLKVRVKFYRITPDNITSLRPGEIFVFGSNEAGRHGKGAAKTAMKWGAQYGKPEGPQGQCYAIPTKDANLNALPASDIKKYVGSFLAYARQSSLTFLVTEIGCGLAGHKPEDIAPLFRGSPTNVWLPKKFWKFLL